MSHNLIANLATELRKEINVQCNGWTCKVQESGFILQLHVWLGEKRRHSAVVLAFPMFSKTGLAVHCKLVLLLKFINFLVIGRWLDETKVIWESRTLLGE